MIPQKLTIAVFKSDSSPHCSCGGAGGKNATEIAELLIGNGADVKAKNNVGDTPLGVASGWGSRLKTLLIENGATEY